jgi:hypothetical protein
MGRGVDIPSVGGQIFPKKIESQLFYHFKDYLNIKILKYDENFEIL